MPTNTEKTTRALGLRWYDPSPGPKRACAIGDPAKTEPARFLLRHRSGLRDLRRSPHRARAQTKSPNSRRGTQRVVLSRLTAASSRATSRLTRLRLTSALRHRACTISAQAKRAISVQADRHLDRRERCRQARSGKKRGHTSACCAASLNLIRSRFRTSRRLPRSQTPR